MGTKKKIVIIGAGLGRCYLASGLVKNFDVTIIEIQSISADLGKRILDLGVPAITNPPHFIRPWWNNKVLA